MASSVINSHAKIQVDKRTVQSITKRITVVGLMRIALTKILVKQILQDVALLIILLKQNAKISTVHNQLMKL